MGKGDYRWRETKKQKKSAKKGLGIITVSQPEPVVEIIKKKGKKETLEEEE